ncbi:hypothetical protein [Rhizobium azibense]|uniref:Uncharacterized protein n=1 Tax=Rhizobium azibense TaxID=1136135 RepID=A0A4R3RI82_9HYPH|nr:hypothetical protein [Rhizobium azibense]TCU34089.1 hypothetical protein EV129_11372 [Rhizobium azibense]
MKIYLVTGGSFTVPGKPMKPFPSLEQANAEAASMVNILREEVDLDNSATAANWKASLEEARAARMEELGLDPETDELSDDRDGFVEIVEMEMPAAAASQQREAVKVPEDATPEMVAAALAVDWSNESEEATVHNVWHAILSALAAPHPVEAEESDGPFHVSRSSDGERHWFSARDAASGVTLPLDTRERAEALVASLNRSFAHHLRMAAPAQTHTVEAEPVACSVKPMRLSDGRTDYFVSIRKGDREVTPHMFREEYKAAYHVALYDWLLNGKEAPDLMAFGQDEFPAQAYYATPQPAVAEPVAWQSMDTAPKDGKHCILAVKEGAFIYSVQGAFQNGQWNAVHRGDVKPLCWMPNVLLPEGIVSAFAATATNGPK